MAWEPSRKFSIEENRWFSVEHVHNQLVSVLKKGINNLLPDDVAEIKFGSVAKYVFVPSKNQLLLVHNQIHTVLSHRWKQLHKDGEASCYVCDFLHNHYEDFCKEHNFTVNQDLDIKIPDYLLK